MKYSEKLRDPRWQKKRLQVLERDGWECQRCGDAKSTLHVHHRYYTQGAEPWDYPHEALLTLCENCHKSESELRPELEARLLHALRKQFLCGDLMALEEAFGDMHVDRNFASSAIALSIQIPEEGARLVERYWEYIRSIKISRRA